jgi:cold-inducible RNA-binding protein
MNKMYVGNLPFSATEDELRNLFSEFGQPTEVLLMSDRDTGRSRGFAFVSMDSSEGMEAAIRGLDSQPLQGRNLVVNEARERVERPRGAATAKAGTGNSRW